MIDVASAVLELDGQLRGLRIVRDAGDVGGPYVGHERSIALTKQLNRSAAMTPTQTGQHSQPTRRTPTRNPVISLAPCQPCGAVGDTKSPGKSADRFEAMVSAPPSLDAPDLLAAARFSDWRSQWVSARMTQLMQQQWQPLRPRYPGARKWPRPPSISFPQVMQ